MFKEKVGKKRISKEEKVLEEKVGNKKSCK